MLLSQYTISNPTDSQCDMTEPFSHLVQPSDLTRDAERNRLLAEMAEQSTDMISRHTPEDWRFIYASPAVTHLLGYEVDEIIGLSAYELYHPDDVEDFKRRSPTVSYERGLYTHTYRFRRKDGQYTWLESTSRSIRDQDTGELKEILVVSRDASHRIETEQANQRLARVLERTSDLVTFITPDLKVSHLNEAAQNTLLLHQIKNDQLNLANLLTKESFDVLSEQGLPAVKEGKPWCAELNMQGGRQEAIPVLLELLAHYSFHGQLEYFSLVARDLSETKQVQAELKRYQDEINHASRLVAVGELASGLAHELNQPLTAIVNYVSGIQRRFGNQDQIAWSELAFPLKKVSDTAMRAGSLIHRIMNFTRKQEPHRELIRLSDVVPDLIEFCAAKAEKHQVRVVNRVEDTSLCVYADRIQLEQILLNLMINGIEASGTISEIDSRDSAWPEVEVSACLDNEGQVRISVSDEGEGIAEDVQDRLFEQFFTTKPKGLGMGLAISHSLVESHGGQLWAENRLTGGACFSFTLKHVREDRDR